MKRIFLLSSMFAAVAGSSFAQCTAVESFDESFDEFTSFPEACWTGGPGAMSFNLQDDATDEGGQEILFYGFTSVGSSFYLVSPELTTINGASYLTFDATPVSALGSGLKVQIGTLESETDFTTFVAHGEEYSVSSTDPIDFESIAIPAADTHKFVAVRFTTSAAHQSLRLDNFKWNVETPAEDCVAIETLDEDFEDFTEFPENCWTSDAGYPYFSLNDEGDKSIGFYTFLTTEDHYLVTPELTTIDGSKMLRFNGIKSGTPGEISVQVGTLSDNEDYTTFIAHGDAFAISSEDETEYTSIAIPASATQKYVALKITASAAHQALDIDDIALVEAPSSLNNLSAEKIQVYPNPATSQLNISVADYQVQQLSISDISGRLIRTVNMPAQQTSVAVSDLANGVYVLRIVAKEGVHQLKFVKR